MRKQIFNQCCLVFIYTILALQCSYFPLKVQLCFSSFFLKKLLYSNRTLTLAKISRVRSPNQPPYTLIIVIFYISYTHMVEYMCVCVKLHRWVGGGNPALISVATMVTRRRHQLSCTQRSTTHVVVNS